MSLWQTCVVQRCREALGGPLPVNGTRGGRGPGPCWASSQRLSSSEFWMAWASGFG